MLLVIISTYVEVWRDDHLMFLHSFLKIFPFHLLLFCAPYCLLEWLLLDSCLSQRSVFDHHLAFVACTCVRIQLKSIFSWLHFDNSPNNCLCITVTVLLLTNIGKIWLGRLAQANMFLVSSLDSNKPREMARCLFMLIVLVWGLPSQHWKIQ